MPARVLRAVLHHVDRHPRRLLVTSVTVLLISLGFATYALRQSFDAAHQGRVENCLAVNELSRKIFITAADLGIPLYQRVKFLPTSNCEDLP